MTQDQEKDSRDWGDNGADTGWRWWRAKQDGQDRRQVENDHTHTKGKLSRVRNGSRSLTEVSSD